MFKSVPFFATLAGVGVLLEVTSGAIAAPSAMQLTASQATTSLTMNHSPASRAFQPIPQPWSHRLIVTLTGLGLIGLELWWFLFSKPQTHQAVLLNDLQEITVTVDGGYEPSQIVVQAGHPVRLNFDRQDPSGCLEEVRLSDFQIVKKLPLKQVTPVEFTPTQPGTYVFTCGMNMFRGVIEVIA